jgi:hypothetical protein
LSRKLTAYGQFYGFLMEWSTLLNRVALLSTYIGPEAQVSTLVRHQLITESEGATITEAILATLNGVRKMETIYDTYLLWTTLDVAKIVAKVGIKPLVEEMFDLTLGSRVKRLQLNGFLDTHEARQLVERFVSKWAKDTVGRSIWWDSNDPSMTPHARWISTALEGDPGFYEVFGRWREESDDLQRWLDYLEGSPAIVNNAASGMDAVYSANVALNIISLAEVKCFYALTERRLIQTVDAGASYGFAQKKRLRQ